MRNKTYRPRWWMAWIIIVATVPTSSAHAGTDTAQVTGTVIYRERMMLPPGAEIKVSLEDVSKQDVAAEVIASTVIEPAGGPPFPFAIDYDSSQIDTRFTYALRARIELDGQLLFINTDHTPAFPEGGGAVEILVRRVAGNAPASGPRPDASLMNTYWKAVRILGEPVSIGAADEELHMVLTEENQVRGYAGCNRFFGGFEADGERITLGPLAATKMWCEGDMDQEDRFLAALGAVGRFNIETDTLTLYNEADQPVLMFEAVYLP